MIGVEVANVVACCGAMGGSMIGVADQLEHVASDYLSRRNAFLVAWLVWVLPLSFPSNLKPLQISASLCLAVSIYIAVLMPIVIFAGDSVGCPIKEADKGSWVPHDGLSVVQLLKALPIYTFCFCAHMTMPGATQDLDSPTERKLDIGIVTATFAASVIFGSVAFVGFYGIGDKTQQDVMKDLPECDLVLIARWGLALVCLCFFPLLLQAVRTTLLSWAGELLGSPSRWARRYYIITVFIACYGLIIGLFVKNLGVVLSIAGSTGFAVICYIFPGRCYLIMFPDGALSMRLQATCLLVYGLVMGPACLVSNFL